jgi:large-conductance mechanosensitive channel
MVAIETELMTWALGVYLGNVFSTFFKTFVKDMVTPLLKDILPLNDAGKSTIVIAGITLDVGDMIVESLNALVSVGVVLLAISVLRSYTAIPMTGGKR